ncbi:hypothetical protein DID76_02720, partial [Candidatus Marinamargulisbacteria bacterium SCGC AG-414-C22]
MSQITPSSPFARGSNENRYEPSANNIREKSYAYTQNTLKQLLSALTKEHSAFFESNKQEKLEALQKLIKYPITKENYDNQKAVLTQNIQLYVSL